jgi:erythromycin 3''-O-methyltransferase
MKLLIVINLILFLIIFICIYLYRHILNKYFVIDDICVYDNYLTNFIQVVSTDNYFMNYGLWDGDNPDLLKANENLANFIFDKAGLTDKKNAKVLDVGCGYGEQDFLWCGKMDSTCNITAVDISEKQISTADKHREQRGIQCEQLSFQQCDALNLLDTFPTTTFDAVFSLESAFHYSDRSKFFNNASSVLKNDGVFVISDIMLSDDYAPNIFTNLFVRMYSDYLHIPKHNLINSTAWQQQLIQSGFDIVELHDITDKTFAPYYDHFFEVYIRNKGLPSCFAGTLNSIFYYTQPFAYNVAVCKKRV